MDAMDGWVGGWMDGWFGGSVLSGFKLLSVVLLSCVATYMYMLSCAHVCPPMNQLDGYRFVCLFVCCWQTNPDGTCNYDAGGDCADGIADYKNNYVDPFVSVLKQCVDVQYMHALDLIWRMTICA